MRTLLGLALLGLAACSQAELGRMSVTTQQPPTLPADCADRLWPQTPDAPQSCDVTVPAPDQVPYPMPPVHFPPFRH